MPYGEIVAAKASLSEKSGRFVSKDSASEKYIESGDITIHSFVIPLEVFNRNFEKLSPYKSNLKSF